MEDPVNVQQRAAQWVGGLADAGVDLADDEQRRVVGAVIHGLWDCLTDGPERTNDPSHSYGWTCDPNEALRWMWFNIEALHSITCDDEAEAARRAHE